MDQINKIKPELCVYARATDGSYSPTGIKVGTVDHLDGEYLKLKKQDSPDGAHHWVPTSWVDRVDPQGVYLNKSDEEVTNGWLAEEPPTMRTAI